MTTYLCGFFFSLAWTFCDLAKEEKSGRKDSSIAIGILLVVLASLVSVVWPVWLGIKVSDLLAEKK